MYGDMVEIMSIQKTLLQYLESSVVMGLLSLGIIYFYRKDNKNIKIIEKKDGEISGLVKTINDNQIRYNEHVKQHMEQLERMASRR